MSDDHDMEDQSEVDEGNTEIQHDDGDSPSNGHDETAAESTERTDYSLYDLIPRIALLRMQLHDLEHPLELPLADFEAVMPYMDNVWRKLKSSEQTESLRNTEIYWCKLRKPPGVKIHTPRPTPEGKQARKRKPKEDKACSMEMKVTYSTGSIKKVTITKGAPHEHHTHDLDFMDAQKRNSGIMNTARKEAVRGFQPASIWWKMQQEMDKLEAAGGTFMKISDVRNVQYPWRQENPDVVLKAHTGYNATRSGPKPGYQPPVPRIKSSPSTKPVQPQPLQSASTPQSGPSGQLVYQPLPRPGTDVLQYPPELRTFLAPYLPNHAAIAANKRLHVTLTWASSLDGRIASSPGYRTPLSGPDTKAMTHYLRSTHDAILIGVRTAIADDPGLNCRLHGAGGYGGAVRHQMQPRPIIIDPNGRLQIRKDMKILQLAATGQGRAPWIVVGRNADLHPTAVSLLKSHGGEYLQLNEVNEYGRFSWEDIFYVLHREGLKSVMIEGGGVILSELLKRRYEDRINSVIMTIAPTFLGSLGVQVTQETEFDSSRNILQSRLRDVTWQPMGASGDAVMCGRIQQPAKSNGILQGIVEMANADADGHAQQDQQHHSPPQVAPAPPTNEYHPPPPPHHSPPQHRPRYPTYAQQAQQPPPPPAHQQHYQPQRPPSQQGPPPPSLAQASPVRQSASPAQPRPR